MTKSSDIVIIGGGINGVSIAFHLAKHGVSVTLLEKGFIASGPTGYSSAIIRQHYSNPITARMALKSLRVWQNFAEIVGGECGYTQTGFLVAVRPQDVEGLKANIAMQQSLGITTSFLSPEELGELEPDMRTGDLGGAAFEPEGGYCDPARAANSFAQAAQRLGVVIHSGVRATGIQIQGERVTGVETNDGLFPAANVLVAAGPWSMGLLRPLGVELPMVAARVKIGLYQPPSDLNYRRVVGDFVNQVYLRPETGGLVLVGSISADEAHDQITNPDQFNDKVDLATLADFGERLARRYPALERGRLAKNFASLYDITPDWHAIMDAVPGYLGLFLCAGTSGHGFKLAPAAGEMMARLVLSGKKPADDIHLFALERFASGKLVRSRYEYSIVG